MMNESRQIKIKKLEQRLIKFSIMVLELQEKINKSRSGAHLGSQLLRSGTSPALNYAEAQVASSLNDFVHKMRICLKELKESYVTLTIILKKPLTTDTKLVESMIDECNELIAIFVSSIKKASEKLK